MENIFYEYRHDKSRVMQVFKGISTKTKKHFHRTVEILYVLDGEIYTTVGDKEFIAGKDDIIFVHNYSVHSFMPKTEYKKYVLIVTPNYENDIDKLLKSSTLPPYLCDRDFNRRELLPIFEKLHELKDSMNDLAKKGYIDVIVGTLFSNYPSFPAKIQGNIEFMVDILHFIDEHYSEPLTLDSIAATFGYNKYYFSRLFNKYIGESLSNYINVVRIRNFMQKCKDMNSPQIAKIAAECGFESMPTFYRSFTKMYGETPKSYFSKG